MAYMPLTKGVIKAAIQPCIEDIAELSDSPDNSGKRDNCILSRSVSHDKWKEYVLFTSKCEYCILESPISGLLTLTRDSLIFEPDERDATVIDSGSGSYQVYIDISSIYECACINAPIHSTFLEDYDERINIKAFLQVLIKNSDLPDSFRHHSSSNFSPSDSPREKFISRSTQKIYNIGSSLYSKFTRIVDYVNPLENNNSKSAKTQNKEPEELQEHIFKEGSITLASSDSFPEYDKKQPHDPVFVLFGFFDIEIVHNLTVLIINLIDDTKNKPKNKNIKTVARLSHSSNSLLQYWLHENRMPVGWITSHSAKEKKSELLNLSSTIDRSIDSDILSIDMFAQLQECIPPDCAARRWKRYFSLVTDGVSLITLYHNLEGVGSCVIVIEDLYENIFGCFTDKLICSSHYYGTPQIFIFKFEDQPDLDKQKIKTYHPDQHGRRFIFSNEERIVIGGDDSGKNAITINKEFLGGTTDRCDIFMNPPLVDTGEYRIKNFEVWGFVDF